MVGGYKRCLDNTHLDRPLEGGGGGGGSWVPSLCPAIVPLTARASANGIHNRQ